MATVPTVKIVNPDKPGEFFNLNESDFDPKKHKRFSEKVVDVKTEASESSGVAGKRGTAKTK